MATPSHTLKKIKNTQASQQAEIIHRDHRFFTRQNVTVDKNIRIEHMVIMKYGSKINEGYWLLAVGQENGYRLLAIGQGKWLQGIGKGKREKGKMKKILVVSRTKNE